MSSAAEDKPQPNSAPLVPRDEREFGIGLELGTGAVLPGGKLNLTYRRKWDYRGDQFRERVEDYADADEDELVQRVEQDERYADTLATAARKAITTGDETTHDWLARLLAAAYQDDSKVETVAFMIDVLAQLDPIHLQVLRRWGRPLRAGAQPRTEDEVGASRQVILAALARLESLGLVQDESATPISGGLGNPAGQRRQVGQDLNRWKLTSFGRELRSWCDDEAVRRDLTGE